MKNQSIDNVPRMLLQELRNVCGDPELAEEVRKLLDTQLEVIDYSSMNAEERLAFCRGEI